MLKVANMLSFKLWIFVSPLVVSRLRNDLSDSLSSSNNPFVTSTLQSPNPKRRFLLWGSSRLLKHRGIRVMGRPVSTKVSPKADPTDHE